MFIQTLWFYSIASIHFLRVQHVFTNIGKYLHVVGHGIWDPRCVFRQIELMRNAGSNPRWNPRCLSDAIYSVDVVNTVLAAAPREHDRRIM